MSAAKRRVGTLCVVLGVLVVGLAGISVADVTRTGDPNDVAGKLDIRGAMGKHPPSGENAETALVHTVTMYEPFDDSVLTQNNVCVKIITRPDGTDTTKTVFNMCAKPRSDGQGFGTKIFKVSPGPKEEVGRGKVLRPDGATVVFLFKKAAIGNPTRYGWRATTGFSDGSAECPVVPQVEGQPPRFGCEDLAPNQGLVQHVLIP